MFDYLINVGLILAPLSFIVAASYVAVNIIAKQVNASEQTFTFNKRAHIFGFLFVLFLSLSSPSITYKNQPHDKVQRNQQIELMNEAKANQPRVIVDMSRQPDLTREERQKRFDDLTNYRKEKNDE